MDFDSEIIGKRIVWVDYAKSLAIFAVILIHTHCDVFLGQVMNAIALPTFFFISGFLFVPERFEKFGPFFKKRFRQIMVPYIWMNVVAYLFWFFVGRRFGDDASNPLQWYIPLRGMLLGIGPDLAHDTPLWSFISFFLVEMTYYWLRRLHGNPVFWILVFFTGAIISGYLTDYIWNLPLVVGTVPGGLFFYSLGQCYKKYRHTQVWNPGIVGYISLLAVFLTMVYYNGDCKFYICRFGNPFLYFIGAVIGIILVLSVSSHLSSLFGERKIVKEISVGTLIICGLHLMVFSFIKGVGFFVFHIPPAEMTIGLLRGFLFATLCMALCVPIVVFIRKYMRWLVDK